MTQLTGMDLTGRLLLASASGDAEPIPVVWEPVLFAMFGSLAINGLNLLEAMRLRSRAPSRSPNLKDPFYWGTFVFYLVLAGGLAFAYERSNQPLTPIVAINLGASAPAILRSLAGAVRWPP